MRGVDADDVAAGLQQRVDALVAIGADADRAADAQAAEVVLGGERVLLRLLDVLDGDEALEQPAAVDDQQLLDAVLVQQLLRGLDAGALAGRDELRLVIIALTGWSRLRSKRMSRLVRMPTGRPSAATTGRPEISWRRISSTAAASFCSGAMVTGLMTTPVSAFLTLVTSRACSAMVRFLWMMPMPPSRAMQMAVAASVTVSMADDTIGFASRMPGVSCVRTSTSFGTTSLSAGTRRTSSNVSASLRWTVRQHLGRLATRPNGRNCYLAPHVAAMASAWALASGLIPGSAENRENSARAPAQSFLATSALPSS